MLIYIFPHIQNDKLKILVNFVIFAKINSLGLKILSVLINKQDCSLFNS